MKAAMIALAALLVGCAPTPKKPTTPPAKKAATPAPTRKPVLLCGANLLISYKSAERPKPGIKRTHAEAKALVLSLALKARANPEAFTALARKHSDGPLASRGGYLGVWQVGTRRPHGYFEKALLELEPGAVSVPVTTPFGFSVLRRLPLPRMFAASHILVAWAGAPRSKATRSKQEARELVDELAGKAAASPASFAELARAHSDCPSARGGGNLGFFPRGSMVPPFQQALEALKVGQISAVVETGFGYHVIRRDEPPTP